MGSLKADDAFGAFKRNVDERSTWRKKRKTMRNQKIARTLSTRSSEISNLGKTGQSP